jgi:acyl-CoA dehydrogenase
VDFAFTEEQEAIRQVAAQIADQVTTERLKEVEAGPDWFDRGLWSDLAAANLLGLALPEDVGGSGFGIVEVCAVLEHLGRVAARVPALPTLVNALAIDRFGSGELRARLLPAVVAGDAVLAAALVEPGGAPPTVPTVEARATADGWELHGSKVCVPAAGLAAAVLIPATTPEGTAVFAVDPDASGVTLTAERATSGTPEFRLDLDAVAVGLHDRLGGDDNGADVVEVIYQHTLVGLAALQVGIVERALRLTAEYTSSREQFGRAIAAFQAVGQRAADAYIDTEAARLTMWQAAWRLSAGLPAADEVAIAKFWAAEAGHRVCAAAQHLHGGIGVDVDYPLHRYTLLAKHNELALGGAAVQLVRLGMSMAAVGDGAAP